jgi:alpha-methylacyl-CoA racemase
VLDFAEARRHPHNQARGSFVDCGGVVQPGPAPRFDGRISQIRPWADCDVPPEQALRDWGVDKGAIAAITKSS